jgi:diguanylate cyclase (GGDEF)-like protein
MESSERKQTHAEIPESEKRIEELGKQLEERDKRIEELEVALLKEQTESAEVIAHFQKQLDDQNGYFEEKMGLDYLTGTNNRKAFDKELDLSLKLIKVEVKENRVGVEQLADISLIMLDIDYFKRVNDIFGHPVGDEVLRKISDLLKNSVRETDMIARVGGEEFVVILKNVNQQFALKKAEEIRLGIEQLSFANPELKVTASLGVVSSESSTDTKILYGYADKALYTAKKAGRNQVKEYAEET